MHKDRSGFAFGIIEETTRKILSFPLLSSTKYCPAALNQLTWSEHNSKANFVANLLSGSTGLHSGPSRKDNLDRWERELLSRFLLFIKPVFRALAPGRPMEFIKPLGCIVTHAGSLPNNRNEFWRGGKLNYVPDIQSRDLLLLLTFLFSCPAFERQP